MAIHPVELFTIELLVLLSRSIIKNRSPNERSDPDVGLAHLVQFPKKLAHLIIRDPRRVGLAHIVAIGNLLSQVGCSRAAAYARDQPLFELPKETRRHGLDQAHVLGGELLGACRE